jgi:iron complex transport system ATP-binding protein
MLQLHNISYLAKTRTLLHRTTCEFNNGELVAIVGANGAGKSTLLRCISGEYPTASGSVIWKGKNIADHRMADLAKARAMLTQANSATTAFTVKEVVMLGRYAHYDYLPAQTDHEIVASSIALQGLDRYKERSYNTLSGGEQQRVHLARVLAQLCEGVENNKPWAKDKLLLLDEPLNNLDIRYQMDMLRSVKQFAEAGNTVVAVLHDINLALHFAHSIVMMKDGKVIAHGRPSEVLTEDNILDCFQIPCQLLPVQHSNKKIIHFIN